MTTRLVTMLQPDAVDRILYGDGPDAAERVRFADTSLVLCRGCGRGAVVSDREDVQVLLELVDEHGWSFTHPDWRCGNCG